MYLTKIDPRRNMRRFYLVRVAPTLLGEHCLIRTTGRIGSAHSAAQSAVTAQQSAVEPSSTAGRIHPCQVA